MAEDPVRVFQRPLLSPVRARRARALQRFLPRPVLFFPFAFCPCSSCSSRFRVRSGDFRFSWHRERTKTRTDSGHASGHSVTPAHARVLSLECPSPCLRRIISLYSYCPHFSRSECLRRASIEGGEGRGRQREEGKLKEKKRRMTTA